MRKFLVVLFVLAALVAVGEIVVAKLAEDRMEERLAAETGAEAEVDIASFPLVTGTLLTERVRALHVTLEDFDADEVRFDELTIDAEGIELPRARLLERNLRPTGIEAGTVAAFVSRASLSDALGVPVEELDLTAVSAELAGGTLTLETPGVGPVSLDLPDEVLPCSGSGVVSADGVRLRCPVETIPDVVLERLPG